MKKYNYFLVNSDVLPDIFQKTVYAKELLVSGEAANVSSAAKKAGISRSAFYKYKDNVFGYEGNTDKKVLNILTRLSDRAGVFSLLTKELYENGANILTVNQSLPIDGIADVSLSMRTDNVAVPINQLIESVKKIDGVVSVKIV